MKWKEALQILNDVQIESGYSIPGPAERVEDVVRFARDVFGFVIPVEFTEFWKVQNGFEFDGNVFYHTDAELIEDIRPLDVATNDAIIASNIIWHEVDVQRCYTFLGDGNIDWYVYHVENEKYHVLDKPSGEVMETYDTFDEFFSTVLTQMVENFRAGQEEDC